MHFAEYTTQNKFNVRGRGLRDQTARNGRREQSKNTSVRDLIPTGPSSQNISRQKRRIERPNSSKLPFFLLPMTTKNSYQVTNVGVKLTIVTFAINI